MRNKSHFVELKGLPLVQNETALKVLRVVYGDKMVSIPTLLMPDRYGYRGEIGRKEYIVQRAIAIDVIFFGVYHRFQLNEHYSFLFLRDDKDVVYRLSVHQSERFHKHYKGTCEIMEGDICLSWWSRKAEEHLYLQPMIQQTIKNGGRIECLPSYSVQKTLVGVENCNYYKETTSELRIPVRRGSQVVEGEK